MKELTLHNYFEDKATPEEILEIDQWLSEDEEHQREFEKAHALFDSIVLQEIDYKEEKQTIKPAKVHHFWNYFSVIAASIVFVAGLLTTGFLVEREYLYDELANTMSVVQVPAGQRMDLTLPDGTQICMNGGSRIEYPLRFDKRVRKVHLSGEAFFDVTHDERQPFVVETFASKVEVLGTEFNVYADEKTETFSTTLLNGKVMVSTHGEDFDQVVLKPNEKVDFVDKRLVVSKVHAQNAISWIDGYINLSGVDFAELMRRFENVYNVRIVNERTDSIVVGYQSGKIKISEGIEFALHILQNACDFTYAIDPATNTVTIK